MRRTLRAKASWAALKGRCFLDLVVCLKTSVLAGSRDHLIVGAACAVSIACLGFGLPRRVAQRITVAMLIVFALMLMLGSVYVDCVKQAML